MTTPIRVPDSPARLADGIAVVKWLVATACALVMISRGFYLDAVPHRLPLLLIIAVALGALGAGSASWVLFSWCEVTLRALDSLMHEHG